MLKELLKQWKRLEPELVNRYWLESTDNQLRLSHIGIIQFAVQQAIVARGWYFDVAYLPLRDGDDKYHADIQVIGAYLQATKADNAAAALLSAYLQALEAVKDGTKC